MREIKFRGKRVDGGGWICGNLIECAITGKKYIFPTGSDANESSKVCEEGCLRIVTFEVVPETVGQFTGLHDKNGKEIYEGDIAKCVSELHSGFGEYPTGKFITKYYEICSISENAYCFGERRIGEKEDICEGILRECAEEYYEVIGNIHDTEVQDESE